MKLTITKIDPYHAILGMVIPELVKRLDESFQALGDESGVTLTGLMTRLWSRDPGILILAAVDEKGDIKGHAAAAQAPDKQIILVQPRQDEPAENDAVTEMLVEIERWAKELGAQQLTLVSRRYDSKWSKKHGFEIAQYVQTKEIG